METKQTLIIIFFMMFLVNFIPRANASLVELEFSNGATVSFDDTLSGQYTEYEGSIWHTTRRGYNTVIASLSHPYNVISNISASDVTSTEGHGSDVADYIKISSQTNSNTRPYQSNHVWTNSGFKLIGSDITASLVDAIGLDNMFHFSAFGLDGISNLVVGIREDATLTSVKLDGVNQLPSQVPVPGAVWLFGTAIVGLIGRRKLGGVK